ncbi:Hypothetical predicted protein [Olea europaea subsp. europaea]|uniref:Uncharacterized protein n=1 Tax=Olea europaea subsp. europaea TaxID=158383 RepID=A0A8S0R1Y2_OLEEU|nr:Hypothetical predicted protein [Olea europaea subsp. europaea]
MTLNQGQGAVNHALVMWTYILNQTWFPVSLEFKNTEICVKVFGEMPYRDLVSWTDDFGVCWVKRMMVALLDR